MGWGRWLLGVVVLMVAVLGGQAAAQPSAAAEARAGVLSLPGIGSSPVVLRGDWVFDWHAWSDPHWLQLPADPVLATVPGRWNAAAPDFKPPGPDGWGSYRLLVDCPSGMRLTVHTDNQNSAMHLYVNGRLVTVQGRPGEAADKTVAAVTTRPPALDTFSCPLRLTAHVANFAHRDGGMVRPVVVGTPDALAALRERTAVQDALLLGVYLLSAVVAVVFFVVRRGVGVMLTFALFCLAMAVYADLLGSRLLLRGLPPMVGWEPLLRLEYIAWLSAMALFFLTVRGLYPAEVRRRCAGIMLGLTGVALAVVLLTPARHYSQFTIGGHVVAVLACLFLAWALARASHRGERDAWVLLVGMVVPLAAMLVDLVLIGRADPGPRWTPLGFALYLLAPAVVLARRLQRVLQLEERSRVLEQHAQLREDVDRMARHDLKTPLSSVLGAARLLGEDLRLGPDQRELVRVVERAGVRMLEMVNLSLGLYRMETGSYDFSPQAVDLQALLARLLDDLLPQAEAAGITLLKSGTGATVQARGEELLCYSILANLVKNAIEATPRGGSVTVGVFPGDPVRVTVHNPGEVPPALAATFFDKYVSAGKTGGTGLGTYSARLMARAQEGDLILRTSASDGTVLELQLRPLALPRVDTAGRPGADAVVPLAAGDLAPRDVLIADDDEFSRLVMRRYLPSPPFSVRLVETGEAAMAAIMRARPQVLLIDKEMPGLDGLSVLTWLREREAAGAGPRCAVLLMSAHDAPTLREAALAAGADAYLSKPVGRDQLWSELHRLQLADGSLPAAPVVPAVPGPQDVVVVEPEWAELFPQFLEAQRGTVREMQQAAQHGDWQRVRLLAHRASGGMSLGGLHWAAGEARCLEQDALDGDAVVLRGRIDALADHLAQVRFRVAVA